MIFNSLEYILFFSIVLAACTFITKRRWPLLLAASYYFYSCWRADYLVLLVFTTLLNYGCAIAISRSSTDRARKTFLVLGLVGSLGVLFVYKYLNFVAEVIDIFLIRLDIPRIAPVVSVVLPIGISFYTFQALSYTIDVFRKRIDPERHVGIFSLFISFFPQLVAGPIERAENLLRQLKQDRGFDYEAVRAGFGLALWGFFKKVVIADRLAIYVDGVYNNLGGYSGIPLLLATYFFTFQIYCDFSGYSDIAIGCAKMMGYDLRKNFDRPYFSSSIQEFWRRWHISLMSWFRDYLYFPLGGNRKGESRKQINQFTVFMVSGLWHGANLTFVLWGLYHAVIQIASNISRPLIDYITDALRIGPGMRRALGMFITFHLVVFGWMFFRANSIRDVTYILGAFPGNVADFSTALGPLGVREFVLTVGSVGLLILTEIAQGSKRLQKSFGYHPFMVRLPAYCMLVIGLLLFGIFQEHPFLYFQF